MPSVFSHAAVPLALTVGLGFGAIPSRLAAVAVVGSMLPDIDALGFAYGIPYQHPLGHRGLTHSLAFAAVVAALVSLAAGRLGTTRGMAFAVLFASIASHGMLDAFTDGGHGVAYLAPFDNRRFRAPWHPIAVSPMRPTRFFTARGLQVLASEARWIWLPASVLAALGFSLRKARDA